MSSINARGQVGHGRGGGQVSIDNLPFSIGGWAGWISDDLAFHSDGSPGNDPWIPSIHNLTTGQTVRAIADPTHPQYNAGMNHGFAGGGVWAAWYGSSSEKRGLFTSYGLHLPNAGLLG